jgi:acetyl-CoA acetyltransferase
VTEVFVVSGVRTPTGRYGGAPAHVRPDDLAALVVGEAVARAGIDPALVDSGGLRGLATMCVGVGQGSSLLVERS